MPTWNPDQYLKFAGERTRPCRDLVNSIELKNPARTIDLGCGPGNSTSVLSARWPDSDITGLDSSADMIASAKERYPDKNWVAGDIDWWASEAGPKYDLVFSNAALQWLHDHETLFPKLLKRVSPGGAFAAQIPGNFDGPAHTLMRAVAATDEFRDSFKTPVREWISYPVSLYYDALAPEVSRTDIWETEYIHVLEGAEGIVEWYKGTGLRPFLEGLPDDEARTRFLAAYLERIRCAYPERPDGKVLFPFRRIFIVAYL